MNLREALRFSYQSLHSNKIRTLLTALGLVIGNASVILVVTISLTSRDYILDQIRVSIPDELKAARRLTQERDQVVADAHSEAERMLRDAEAQAMERVAEHSLVRIAEMRAAGMSPTGRRPV